MVFDFDIVRQVTSATNPGHAMDSTPAQSDRDLIEAAVSALSAANPFSLLSPGQTAAAADRVSRATLRQPAAIARRFGDFVAESAKITMGTSEIDLTADRRFTHEQYDRNPILRRAGQRYLAFTRSVHELIDDLELDAKSNLRGHFVAGLLTDAAAPTNTLAGNPAAIREAVDTRGESLRDGFRHWLHDQRENGGMPSMVDTRPFVVGETIATTPGEVVFRNEVLELIHYEPATEQVRERPVFIVPPQINKYYVLDLAEKRSLVEAAVAAGQQVFMVSWRNPTAEQSEWNLDHYVAALLEGIDVALDLTGQPNLNMLGVCAGGITTASLLGHLAAISDQRVNAVTFLVTILDWDVPSTIGTFTSGPAVAASIQKSQRDGILSGEDLGRLFAWLRPNDLVWNYWVNNYLMGKNPPAFDILSWNVDATNLPAGLHADFLGIASDNTLTKPNELEVLATKVDLSSVTCDAYVVAGYTDHITPWEGCYNTVDLLGGNTEFVLCKSGHVQTLVCPGDNPKARYFTNPDRAADANSWKEGATEHTGSWWGHWLTWMDERGGELIDAPARLDSDEHPSLGTAPGQYVLG